MRTVLVTGATGTVGSQVVEALSREPNVRVRIGVRAPEKNSVAGVEAVHFSYADDASMSAACAGTDSVFWVTPAMPGMAAVAQGFLAAAKSAGAGHLVKLSVATMADPRPMTIAQWHNEMEAAMRASGIPWTSLRPNGFMQNFLNNSAPQPDGGIYLPMGNGAASYINVRDIAAVAVKTLTENGHEGKIYDLSGPEALTGSQVAQAIAAATGRSIRYVDVPEAAARQAMLGANMPEWMVDMILDIQAHTRRGESAQITDHVQKVTGKPPRTFAQFALDHADHWK